MRLERSDRSTVATTDMPSSCHIDSARRRAERAKPIRITTVSGPKVLALSGCSPTRSILTTRTEKGARLLASLVDSLSALCGTVTIVERDV